MANQIFQIAAVAGHAAKMGTEWSVPSNRHTQTLKMFFPNIQLGPLEESLPVHREPSFNYSPIPEKEDLDLFGYFQCEKYWNGVDMHELFKPFQETVDHVTKRHKMDHLTCAIHIRRGDYLNFKHVFTDLAATDYYGKAIKKMQEFGVNKFIIFSDDIDFCKKYISGSHIEYSEGLSGFEDFILMSQMQYCIMANSSYSWWASYLGKARTIAPEQWFAPGHHENPNDLFREDMILI